MMFPFVARIILKHDKYKCDHVWLIFWDVSFQLWSFVNTSKCVPGWSVRCVFIFFIYETSYGRNRTLVLLCVCYTSRVVNLTSSSLYLVLFKKTLPYTAHEAQFKVTVYNSHMRRNYSFMENVFQVSVFCPEKQNIVNTQS